MCGIFGYVGKQQDAAARVLDGLKKLEYRGYDSWGIVVSHERKLVVKKRVGKIGDAPLPQLPHSGFGLGHTRWATHGGVTQKNAHPHLDCSRTIALVHNGIIENYEDLKKNTLQQKHRFISDTDTEVAVHLIEELRTTYSFVQAVRKAFLQLDGLNALIAMDAASQTFVAVKSGSPLVIGFGKGENFIASDAPALLAHTKTVHFLHDFEMAVVTAGSVSVRTVSFGRAKQFSKQILRWKPESVQKGAYEHFMLKEIHEQPGVVANIARAQIPAAQKLAAVIKHSYGTYLTGCGTAAYACLAGTYLFSKVAKRHVNFAVGSEFGYLTDFLTDKSLVLALSQSGETIDIIDSIKRARQKKARIAALVNVLGSTLYREADMHMLLLAGPEKAVASTKAFTAKLATLFLLAYELAGDIQSGVKLLESAARQMHRLLQSDQQNEIVNIAKQIHRRDHMYIIGRGLSYPLALEAALKIKEISYIHAEGLAAGELKHGPIALIEKGTPCMVFAPDDETYGANLAGAMEMKARGGFIIGASHKPSEVFDAFIKVADCGEATIIPNVLVAQLLAYYLALKRGNNPDMPRNLAKSVTVK